MGRVPISTQVVTAVLVVGVALAGGVSAAWCIWWQAAYIVLILLAVVLLGMREVNRARIKGRKMLDRLDEQDEFMREAIRASSEESQAKSATQLAQVRRDILRGFQAAEERDRQAADPAYILPLSACGTVRSDTPAISANAELGPRPPRRERVRQRLIYICKWVWGTHDAPSAKRRKS